MMRSKSPKLQLHATYQLPGNRVQSSLRRHRIRGIRENLRIQWLKATLNDGSKKLKHVTLLELLGVSKIIHHLKFTE